MSSKDRKLVVLDLVEDEHEGESSQERRVSSARLSTKVRSLRLSLTKRTSSGGASQRLSVTLYSSVGNGIRRVQSGIRKLRRQSTDRTTNKTLMDILAIPALAEVVVSFLPRWGIGSSFAITNVMCHQTAFEACQELKVGPFITFEMLERLLVRFTHPSCRLRKLVLNDVSMDTLPTALFILLTTTLHEVEFQKCFIPSMSFASSGLAEDIQPTPQNWLAARILDYVPQTVSFRNLCSTQEPSRIQNEPLRIPLRRLDLGDQDPKSIDNCIADALMNLSHLKLSLKFSLDPDQLPHWLSGHSCKNLQELQIQQTDLVTFPDAIKDLKQLRVLQLKHNRPAFWLPSWLGSELPQLQVLELMDCRLRNLPERLSDYMNLRELNLSDNTRTLEVLPNWAGEVLPSLETFHVQRCGLQLAHLSAWFSSMPNVKTLNFKGNPYLGDIPNWFSHKLSSLTSVNLASCGLNKVPDVLSKLNGLKEMRLDCNFSIESLPMWFNDSLPNLEYLSVTTCRLDSRQHPFAGLLWLMGHPRLQELHLAHNIELGNLPPDFLSSFPSLRVLNVSSCGIQTWGNSSGSTRSLKVAQEQQQSDNDQTSKLQSLYLGYNISLGSPFLLPGGMMNFGEHCKSLTFLSLNACDLQEIPSSIKMLVQLRELELSRNNFESMSEFPAELEPVFEKLEVLNLDRCNLSTCPMPTSTLKRLKQLALSTNSIESLPMTMELYCPVIQSLDISSNLLTALPNSIGNLRELTELHIDNNPIVSIPKSICELISLRQFTISIEHLDSISVRNATKIPFWNGQRSTFLNGAASRLASESTE